ncbi:MAG: hypothetical protein ACRBBP_09145 [Bdellovibrionales bacterium]
MIRLLFVLNFLYVSSALASEAALSFSDFELGLKSKKTMNYKFREYEKKIKYLKKRNIVEGNSYIVSGALSLIGGTLGGGISEDQTEQLAYSAFQSIGVAAIGYGLYKKKIGGEREHIFDMINESKFLSSHEKYKLLSKYYKNKKIRERKENLIKALTHGLVGALNMYSATQQDNDRLKTTLYFVGGVNVLASVSYAF